MAVVSRGQDLAGRAVVAYLAVVPVAFARITVDGFEQVKLWALLTAALAVAALAPSWLDPREAAPACRLPGSSLVVLLYLAAGALATVSSSSVATSLFGADESHAGLTATVALVALFLAARRLGACAHWRAALVTAIVAGTAVAAAYAGVQALGRDPLQWGRLARFGGWSRPFGTMGHPNHLGGLLAMVLPLQLWLVSVAFARRRRTAGSALALGALVSAAALVATLSRAAWCAALAALVVALVLWRAQRRHLPLIFAALAAGAAAVGAVAAHTGLGVALGARVRSLLVAGPRVQIWRAAWDAFRDHPLFGNGLDTFATAFSRHRPPLFWAMEYEATPTKAHNELLQALATQGLLGGIAWLAVVAGLIALGIRVLRRGREPDRGLAVALVAGCAAFVVGAAVGFPVVVTASVLVTSAGMLSSLPVAHEDGVAQSAARAATPFSPGSIATLSATVFALGVLSDPALASTPLGAVLAVMAAGAVAAASQAWAAATTLGAPAGALQGSDTPSGRTADGGTQGGAASRVSLTGVTGAVLAWTFLVALPCAASVVAQRAEGAPARQAVDRLALAHRLDPLRVRYLRRLGLAILNLELPGDSQGVQWLTRSRDALLAGIRLAPQDGYGWASLAAAETRLALAGALDRGQPFRSIEHALRLDPANVTFCLAGANAALELGELERARRFAEAAARLSPQSAAARAQLAHVAAREGRLEEAIRLLTEALALEWYGQAPARHTAQANLAALLTRAQRFREAEDVARALVAEDPQFPPGHYQLGRALQGLGLADAAAAEYDRTLRLQPSHRGARDALGR